MFSSKISQKYAHSFFVIMLSHKHKLNQIHSLGRGKANMLIYTGVHL